MDLQRFHEFKTLIQEFMDHNQYVQAHYHLEKMMYTNEDRQYLRKLFHWALSENQVDIMNLLLDDIIDPNKILYREFYPLEVAIRLNNFNMLHLLLDHGADPNIHPRILINAIKKDYVDLVHELLRYGANPNRGFTNKQPLFYLRGPHRFEIAHLLIEYGADINVKNQKRGSLLHYYIYFQDYDLVKYLLHEGADPNIQDDEGCTPLILAVKRRYHLPDLIKSLIDSGADPQIQNNKGETPFSIIDKYRWKDPYGEIRKILNSFVEIPSLKEPEFY